MRIRIVILTLVAVALVGGVTVFAQGEAPAGGESPGIITGGVITPEIGAAPQIHKIPIAVPLFRDESETDGGDTARKMAEVLSDDMEMSGEFEVIDRARYLEDPRTAGVKAGEFEFANWSLIGAEYLIKSSFTKNGDQITMSLRLFNVLTQQMRVGKEYNGSFEERFNMVHMFSREVFLELFGDPGFFGSRIAFASGTKDIREIYVMDADGRNRQRLTNLGMLAMSPKWSPDGKEILFAVQGPNIPPSVYSVEVKTGKTKKVFVANSGVALTPDWMPGGETFAVALSHDANTEIYEVDLKGNIKRNMTKHWAIELAPAFGPNGSQMLFISDRSGAPQVYKLDIAGGDPSRISFFGSYNQSPTWAKRGGKIAYSAREFGHYTIYLIDENGGEPYALTADMQPSCEYASFSPDGRILVFSCETSKGRALWMRTSNDAYTRRLTQGTSYDTGPSWGPLPTE